MKALEHLQEVDFKIDHLIKRKTSLPDSVRLLNESFQKMQLTTDTKKNAFTEVEKLIRQTEAAIELNNDRLTRAHTKLETVHNSQEFQAANKEIDQLKKLNTTLDEQLKKNKQDLELLNQEINQIDTDFLKLKTDRETQMTVVSSESAQLDAEIATLTQEREKFLPSIEVRISRQYDRVRGARGGMGCVHAVGGRCSGCNMMLPPQLFNEVYRANDLQQCPSCHRILLIPSVSGEASSQAEAKTGT